LLYHANAARFVLILKLIRQVQKQNILTVE